MMEMINTKKSNSSAQSSEMNLEKALKLFFNTCELKFLYWFETNILPIYLTQGSDSVTPSLVKKTFDNFQNDVKVCVHPIIFEILLKYYFSDKRKLL